MFSVFIDGLHNALASLYFAQCIKTFLHILIRQSVTCHLNRFEKLLNQIYSFFSRSAVHTAELIEMQCILDHPQLKLKKACETRWLSLENVVNAALSRLNAFLIKKQMMVMQLL